MQAGRIVREPLLHFLLLGAALFAAYAWLNRESADADPRTIVVDRDRLLTHLQYTSRAFDPERFGEMLDAMDREDLQRLIDEYVREEAMYREARALQLDKNDYVSRMRLIQQLEFIARGFAEVQADAGEEELQQYYETHKQEYYVSPKVTFTHVFFGVQGHGERRAEELARAELRKLNERNVQFGEAPAYGERFLYQLNYVERDRAEVASHFGAPMQAQLFALRPSERTWQGPLRSEHGFHLVLLTRHDAGYQPSLAQVRSEVERNVRRSILDGRLEQSIQSIVGAYNVQVEGTLSRRDQRASQKARS